MIHVIGPRDKVPEGAVVINTTSKVKSIFSPFYNPTVLPIQSRNMENAWQYSKVYEGYETDGEPNENWYLWSQAGFMKKFADRYPMGKGAVPLYSWLNGKKLDYIQARKELYIPLYKNSLVLKHYKEMDILLSYHQHNDIALWDYDGYLTEDSFDTIVNNPEKKMGHAFVLREIMLERLATSKVFTYDATS